MRARLLPLTRPLLLLLAAALGCGSAPRAFGPPAPRLAAVTLVDLTRAPRSVDTLRAGRVALVSFWATWCDACEKELAALNRLHARTTGEHAVVIGVAVGESPATVRRFVEAHDLRYAQLVDEDLRLTDALGQRRLPATLVVSRAGEVVFTGGLLDTNALAAFRRALAEPTEPTAAAAPAAAALPLHPSLP